MRSTCYRHLAVKESKISMVQWLGWYVPYHTAFAGWTRIEIQSRWWKICRHFHFLQYCLISISDGIAVGCDWFPGHQFPTSLIHSCKSQSPNGHRCGFQSWASPAAVHLHLIARALQNTTVSEEGIYLHQVPNYANPEHEKWRGECGLPQDDWWGWLVLSPLLYRPKALSWEQLSHHISVALLQVLGQWRLNRVNIILQWLILGEDLWWIIKLSWNLFQAHAPQMNALSLFIGSSTIGHYSPSPQLGYTIFPSCLSASYWKAVCALSTCSPSLYQMLD